MISLACIDAPKIFVQDGANSEVAMCRFCACAFPLSSFPKVQILCLCAPIVIISQVISSIFFQVSDAVEKTLFDLKRQA